MLYFSNIIPLSHPVSCFYIAANQMIDINIAKYKIHGKMLLFLDND